MSSSKYHVIIVGAGWYGIAAAKMYLQLDPSVSLLLIDDSPSIGGVWSRSRVYPHLYSNQPTPVFEFPDLSMKDALGVKDWTDISGDMMASYLELYAAKFGVIDHCKFNTQVQRIDRDSISTNWQVFVRPTAEPAMDLQELRCEKLIMATGFTSTPKLPQNIDLSAYTGKAFHVKELAQRYREILDDPNIKNITVVGGSKSAWEASGLFALEGKKVNWLIQEGGAGPATMIRARPDGKKHMMEGMNNRLMGVLGPNGYYPDRWITQFLYGGKNWFGRWFAANFWKMPLKADLKKLDTPTRRVLKPLSDSFLWLSSGLSMSHPHDELIWDLIDEGDLLTVARASILSTTDKTLTLSNNTTLKSDALILATGWSPSYRLPNGSSIFTPALALELELAIPLSAEPEDHKAHWEILEAEAKAKVLNRFPLLGSPPDNLNLENRPARHYSNRHHFRFLVPPAAASRGDRNIVFLSNTHVGQLTIHSYASALWSYAYLENLLPDKQNAPIAGLLEDRKAMEKDIAWTDTYFRLRYLDLIEGVSLSAFETRDVIDRLLLDLGVRPDRLAMCVGKGVWCEAWKKWWNEMFGSYNSAVYEGIVEEFLEVVDNK